MVLFTELFNNATESELSEKYSKNADTHAKI